MFDQTDRRTVLKRGALATTSIATLGSLASPVSATSYGQLGGGGDDVSSETDHNANGEIGLGVYGPKDSKAPTSDAILNPGWCALIEGDSNNSRIDIDNLELQVTHSNYAGTGNEPTVELSGQYAWSDEYTGGYDGPVEASISYSIGFVSLSWTPEGGESNNGVDQTDGSASYNFGSVITDANYDTITADGGFDLIVNKLDDNTGTVYFDVSLTATYDYENVSGGGPSPGDESISMSVYDTVSITWS